MLCLWDEKVRDGGTHAGGRPRPADRLRLRTAGAQMVRNLGDGHPERCFKCDHRLVEGG